MENIKNISEENFSYKFDILIAPSSRVAHQRRQDRQSINSNLSNAYYLTEYYDSVSGLTMRFKGIQGLNDEQVIYSSVDEFDESDTQTEFSEFPLHWVFNFLFCIGKRFHGLEKHIVIKWPAYMEKEFQRMGISPENFDDYAESDILDIEKRDKDFFELIGKPKISCHTIFYIDTTLDMSSNYQRFEIDGKGISYQVKLKIFWPGENSRIDEHIPPIDK